MASYPFKDIEEKWQEFWKDNKIYKVVEDYSKPKFYILDMFPYPSGQGLHIGHPEGYTATDIIARYKRMKGFNVLHPMGFDAFGLPTERYSMQTGIHPYVATNNNIEIFQNQLNMLGFGYDWSRIINTTDPGYYKWTQWMYLQIYNSWFDENLNKARHVGELPIPSGLKTRKEIDEYIDSKRLAYIAMIPVNWCEELGTVLANEECDEWREKGYTVERKPMKQWLIRITAYAQRLLDDLELVDWPHSTKEMQKNWIGRSEGAEIQFRIKGINESIAVFTTRPDTVFGATYMVLAPEHELVKIITNKDKAREVDAYIYSASMKSDLERTELNKVKTGIFTGAYAINPATNTDIPIWIADYVLSHYGTGAIMAVPGHDERDHEFAKTFGLPIIKVVAPADGSEWDIQESAYVDEGAAVNSLNNEFSINDLPTKKAFDKTIEWLESKKIGCRKIQYKLRDWLFSRQRYWGEPIPIMFFEDGTKRNLELDELPLMLPDVPDFKPSGTGESPLAKVESWVNFIDKKTGKKGRFETNTMPQWAGSCWYYLRYIDPNNDDIFCSKEKEKYWMQPDGVDLYVGGAEHAVLHLLYARFWHKLLYDYGYVSTIEPFKKLFHQGLIIGEDGRKMSKSLGNVINPDDVVEEFGTDSLRMFEMFLGPLQDAKPWSKSGIEGVNRFLSRVWRMIVEDNGTLSVNVKDVRLSLEQEQILHYTIKKVSDDIEELHFNTAVSQMMIFVNEFTKYEIKPREAMEKFILCLSPFAPHIAEELWQILGHNDSIVLRNFPEFDELKAAKKQIEFVVQVQSRIRAKLYVAPGLEQEEIQQMALKDDKVQKFIEGKTIKKVIFVPNKLINFIV
ncbi:MAG: leucine--tRNA ligase [Ignavibacteria bacterium GWB2_35_12]|nr:MAG: leucine--tRNA ligase [Ignavibacteria bacterium GWA2_35_8]OGU39085.1 MAG: leucine--tRNA ligase [Ignavibacteria bacterium GWB2_35_12]OGU97193.1 MAG: leucine--tRNA ligase [Ignavibacteria bacterium RIFOXYA2_FULL_35_10]OGV21794.1 MAG: leucine--tRNA ligase [Ignavibacteria bacterium RIFOXYC2_FULL_35_21]